MAKTDITATCRIKENEIAQLNEYKEKHGLAPETSFRDLFLHIFNNHNHESGINTDDYTDELEHLKQNIEILNQDIESIQLQANENAQIASRLQLENDELQQKLAIKNSLQPKDENTVLVELSPVEYALLQHVCKMQGLTETPNKNAAMMLYNLFIQYQMFGLHDFKIRVKQGDTTSQKNVISLGKSQIKAFYDEYRNK